MSQCLYKPFRSFGRNTNVKVNLSNCATKTDLKNVTHFDTSDFTLRANFSNLKNKVDILEVDKLRQVRFPLTWVNWVL